MAGQAGLDRARAGGVGQAVLGWKRAGVVGRGSGSEGQVLNVLVLAGVQKRLAGKCGIQSTKIQTQSALL
jgi:hypothetical protein